MPYLVHGGAAAFKMDTMKKVAGLGKVKVRVSGKTLAPIIAALEHYESVLNSLDPVEKQSALCTVIAKCRKWKDLKSAKIAATEDPDATVKKRSTRVQALMDEAWTALHATDGGATADAFRAYDARRQAGAHRTGTMAPGYAQERQAYLASGKTKSVSASLIDDLLDRGRTRNTSLPPGPNDNPERMAAVARYQALKGQMNNAVKQRPLQSLTVDDWRKIEMIASTTGEALETRYMPRGERLRYMLESDGNGGLRYAVGQRSAQTVGAAQWPYAMDEWGNMFTAHDETPQNRAGYAMFNHSSFAAGDDVVCAGMLEIDAMGRLTFIDTNSGHYKPSADQLRAIVYILRDEYDVDLTATEIHVLNPDGSRIKWGVGEAPNFLAGTPPLQVPNKPLPPTPPF